jgi:lysylphosphatidylglycerol synthetase-like protein (DUF2156 family)
MVSEGTAIVLVAAFSVLILYVWRSETYDSAWRWMLLFGFLAYVFSLLADLAGGERPVTLVLAAVLFVPAVILAVYLLGRETFNLGDSGDDGPS